MHTHIFPEEVQAYLDLQPMDVQERLISIYNFIAKQVPTATITISYSMPAMRYLGPLVYFAGYKHHIGFYPLPSGMSMYKDQLSKFKHSKGAIQFPHDQPLPFELIEQIVAFRVIENEMKQHKKEHASPTD